MLREAQELKVSLKCLKHLETSLKLRYKKTPEGGIISLGVFHGQACLICGRNRAKSTCRRWIASTS